MTAPYQIPLKLSDYPTERGGCFFVSDAMGVKLATVHYDTSGDPVSRSVRKLMKRDDAIEVAKAIARALTEGAANPAAPPFPR